jgi:hypothetical protein
MSTSEKRRQRQIRLATSRPALTSARRVSVVSGRPFTSGTPHTGGTLMTKCILAQRAARDVLNTQLLVEVTFWLIFFVVVPAVTGTTVAEP